MYVSQDGGRVVSCVSHILKGLFSPLGRLRDDASSPSLLRYPRSGRRMREGKVLGSRPCSSEQVVGIGTPSVLVPRAPLVSFSLGRCSSLPTALLLLDDGHGCGNELDTPVAAVGPGVELAVVVEVVLAVELVLAAELA